MDGKIDYSENDPSWEFDCLDTMRDIFGDEAIDHFCILNAFRYTYASMRRYKTIPAKESYRYNLPKAKKYIDMVIKRVEEVKTKECDTENM